MQYTKDTIEDMDKDSVRMKAPTDMNVVLIEVKDIYIRM